LGAFAALWFAAVRLAEVRSERRDGVFRGRCGRPRCVPGVSMAALAGCGRHRDARDEEVPQVWRKAGTRSDFREADVREKPHLAETVTKMPGTARFRAS
jgi:hypothetical protein